MTRRTANRELVPEELLELNPADAARLGVADGGGDRGDEPPRRRSTLAAQVTERAAPGQVFMAFHFPEAPANELTSQAADTSRRAPSTR